MPMPSLKEYYDMLDKHDWYYNFSDDFRVWSHGDDVARVLADIASLSDEHAKLYSAFEDYYFSGPAFGSAKIDKPQRPGA